MGCPSQSCRSTIWIARRFVWLFFITYKIHEMPQVLAFQGSSITLHPHSKPMYFLRMNSNQLFSSVKSTRDVNPKKFHTTRLFCEKIQKTDEREQHNGHNRTNMSIWNERSKLFSLSKDYLLLIRPVTLFQAVGAFTVGKLVMLMQSQQNVPIPYATTLKNYILASLSIYLSYGAGMAMNDIVDANSIDAYHPTKQFRPIPSGKISTKHAWTFVTVLSVASCVISMLLSSSITSTPQPSNLFLIWTLSNLFIMFAYAKLGFQNILFLKNILVGYLSVSPLLGASIVTGGFINQSEQQDLVGSSLSFCTERLRYLTIVGLGLGTAREIIKDMEDMDVDAAAGKLTLPAVFGMRASHTIAYSMVAAVCFIISSSSFIKLFAQKPYWGHAVRIAPGIILSIRAALSKNISEGQLLLKKSIYTFLMGSIIGLIQMMITGNIY